MHRVVVTGAAEGGQAAEQSEWRFRLGDGDAQVAGGQFGDDGEAAVDVDEVEVGLGQVADLESGIDGSGY